MPAAVVELANRILAALPVDVPPGRSYRADGDLRFTMEYDHVVVAEPADIVEADARGLHLLYIAVT